MDAPDPRALRIARALGMWVSLEPMRREKGRFTWDGRMLFVGLLDDAPGNFEHEIAHY